MEASLIVALSAFLKHCIGLVTRPYETCRAIVERGGYGELVYIALLSTVYFAVASLVKIASFRPFLISRVFMVLVAASVVTYLLTVVLFWTVGTMVGAAGKFKGLAVSWGYTLLPTIVWFMATSILYALLPPPRTTSPAGIAFSVLFLIFSVTLFFWKATLTYLTLRFGLRLGLGKILIVLAVSVPILAGYSIGMYKLGIFRIPFL